MSNTTPPLPRHDHPRLHGEHFTRIGEDALEGASHPIAIYSVHGMGEQVRFQDIDRICSAIIGGTVQAGGQVRSVTTRVASVNGTAHPRAEIVLEPKGRELVEVHVYEAYWAPITEGRVTLKDAVDFLTQAGWDGFKFAKRRDYLRWGFDHWQRYPLRSSLRTWFLFLIAVLSAMIAINTALGLLLAGTDIVGLASDRFNRTVIFTASVYLTIILAVAAVTGLSFLADKMANEKAVKSGQTQSHAASKSFGRTRSSALLVFTLITFVVMAVPTGALLANPSWYQANLPQLMIRTQYSWLTACYTWAIILLCAWIAKRARAWIVDYVGDLAVYLSAHRASKYDQLRDQIQDKACGVLRDIYAARTGNAAVYENVIVVGHSLGSVIAYDALGATMREQALNPTAFPGTQSVAERTALFLTCGSPLNTTAFLFRTQQSGDPIVREMLATSMQPMLVSNAYRPRSWVNIWTNMDPIGGKLTFYNPINPALPTAKEVLNRLDNFGTIPFVSHSDYFEHTELRQQLLDHL